MNSIYHEDIAAAFIISIFNGKSKEDICREFQLNNGEYNVLLNRCGLIEI